MPRILFFIIITCLLQACAYRHHDDVRPNVSGIHSITLSTDDQFSGYKLAKPQIEFFCEEQHKMAYVLSEKYQYTGNMSESDYQTSRAAARVAEGIGNAAWAFSESDAKHAGAIGQVTSDLIGHGYSYSMTFKCQ